MANTPLRSRPYPLESDSPDVASDLHALALNLDVVPNCTSGTTLPSSGMVAGDEFRNTTTGIQYKYTGSAWVRMSLVGAWTNMTINTGAGWVLDQQPRMRFEGDVVRIGGSVLNSSGSTITGFATVATYPSGFAPTINAVHPRFAAAVTINGGGVASTVASVEVVGGGTLGIVLGQLQTVPNGYALNFEGMTYSTS